MTLHQYLAYAAVTSPIILALIFLTLTFKSWLDRRLFVKNTIFGLVAQRESMKELFAGDDAEAFDDHVATTPGIRDYNKK